MLPEHILDLQNKRIVCAAKENDGKIFEKRNIEFHYAQIIEDNVRNKKDSILSSHTRVSST